MIKARGKGKIPKSEWGKIANRHLTGEALASIARDYACTAPAIRYIVSRSAGRDRGVPLRDRPLARRPAAGVPDRASDEQGTPGQGQTIADQSLLGVALRKRIMSDVATFLVAIDAVGSKPSEEMLARLRGATDELMRCAARILIELQRYDQVMQIRGTATG